MHGERFDIAATRDRRLAGKSVSSLAFMVDRRWNEDVTLPIGFLLNSFPLRTTSVTQPRVVKFDILQGDAFEGFVLTQGENFWVLLSEGMLKKSIEVTRNLVSLLADSEQSMISPQNQLKFLRLSSYFVLELLISHELYHISQGHVGYLCETIGVGPAEFNVPGSMKTRSMELLVDEASITSATARTIHNKWYVIPPETPEYFTQMEMLDALSISVIGYVTCLSSASPLGSDAYPSLRARLIRIGDIYPQAMASSGLNPYEVFERFRDNFAIAKTAWHQLDPGGLSSIGPILEGLHDVNAINRARAEIGLICDEIRQNLPHWQPYKCQIVPW